MSADKWPLFCIQKQKLLLQILIDDGRIDESDRLLVGARPKALFATLIKYCSGLYIRWPLLCAPIERGYADLLSYLCE